MALTKISTRKYFNPNMCYFIRFRVAFAQNIKLESKRTHKKKTFRYIKKVKVCRINFQPTFLSPLEQWIMSKPVRYPQKIVGFLTIPSQPYEQLASFRYQRDRYHVTYLFPQHLEFKSSPWNFFWIISDFFQFDAHFWKNIADNHSQIIAIGESAEL